MYSLLNASNGKSLPKLAGVPFIFLTNPTVWSPDAAPLALVTQHNLASPFGLVAKCIQGKAQNVFDPVFSSTILIILVIFSFMLNTYLSYAIIYTHADTMSINILHEY